MAGALKKLCRGDGDGWDRLYKTCRLTSSDELMGHRAAQANGQKQESEVSAADEKEKRWKCCQCHFAKHQGKVTFLKIRDLTVLKWRGKVY